MAYVISRRDPANMETKEIFAEFDGFTALAVEVVERYSALLVELRKRREPHPFFRHTVLAFFQQIADTQLSPEAAIVLGNQDMIKAVLPLSHEDQIVIAYGREVAIARISGTGKIVSDNVPIQRMDRATMARAFGPEGIRPVHEQAEIIRAEGRIERHGMITVLRDEVMLKIGNQKIKPEELKGPLLALGYTLSVSRSVEAKAG